MLYFTKMVERRLKLKNYRNGGYSIVTPVRKSTLL